MARLTIRVGDELRAQLERLRESKHEPLSEVLRRLIRDALAKLPQG